MEGNYLNRYVASGTDIPEPPLLPEMELWTEVILLAIDDLNRRTRFSSHSDQRSAKQWIDSDAEEIGSFIWACQAINVDPNFIRAKLTNKHRAQKRGEIAARSSAQASEKLSGSVTDIAEESRSRAIRCDVFKKAG